MLSRELMRRLGASGASKQLDTLKGFGRLGT